MATHSLPHGLENCECYSLRGKSLPSGERKPVGVAERGPSPSEIDGISLGSPLSWKITLLMAGTFG